MRRVFQRVLELRVLLATALALLFVLGGWAVEIWYDLDDLAESRAVNSSVVQSLGQLELEAASVAHATFQSAHEGDPKIEADDLLRSLGELERSIAAPGGQPDELLARQLIRLRATAARVGDLAGRSLSDDDVQVILHLADALITESRIAVRDVQDQQDALFADLRQELAELFGLIGLCGVCLVALGGAFVASHRALQRQANEEQRRRIAELRYRTVFQQAGVGVALIESTTGRFLEVNRRYCEIAGRTEAEMINTTFMAITHPDDLDRDLRGMEEMAAGKRREFAMEKRYVRPGGSNVWVNLNVAAMWDPGDKPTTHIAVVEDVTGRKRVEAALQESERKYRTFFDLSPDAIFLLLAEGPDAGRILSANTAAAKMHGYSRDELLSMHIADLDAPQDRARIPERMAEVSSGVPIQFEIDHLRKDGSQFPVEVNTCAVRIGGRLCVLAIDRDITDRKRAEGELKASEERYRQLFERDSAGVFYSYFDSGEIVCNDAFVHMLGYSSRVELSSVPRTAFYESPQARDEYLKRLRAEGHIRNLEICLRRKDGTLFEALESVSCLRDATGREYVQGTVVDITERNRAERALRASEIRYRRLFERDLAGIYYSQRDHGLRDCNDAFMRMLGYDSKEELLSRPPEELYPSTQDRAAFLARLANKGQLANTYIRLRRKDGSIIEALENVLLYRDADGQEYFQGTIFDVTEARQAERALQESEERKRLLIESSPICIHEIDQDGRIRSMNRTGLSMLGFERPDQVEGRFFLDFVAEEERARVAEFVSAAVSGHAVDFEFRTLHGRVYRKSLVPDYDANGSVRRVIAWASDITDQKAAQAAIAQSEREYRGLFENAHDAILIFRPEDEVILDVNQRACQIYGIPREAFIGLSLKSISADVPRGERQIRDTLRAGAMLGFESAQRRADGSVIEIEVNAAVIQYRGQPAILSINRDVTERKAAEQRLQKREQELAHFGRLSVMGEMASGMAHELNQPLTAIANYCRGAKMRMAQWQVADPDLMAAIESAGREAHRAAEIIRGLARFVRKHDSQQSRIRVNPLVREAVLLAATEIRRTNVSVELDLSLENPEITADNVQIQQVLLNLVRNGLEAMEHLDAADRVLKVRTALVEGGVSVAVSDRGAGLSDEATRNLFQPFYSTKRNGMGMGLPISKSIVDAHGGRMAAVANSDRGVTFEFTLPRAS